MTEHVKHHPSLSLLELYCDGSLTAEVALLVAAHLEYCPHCQQLKRDLDNELGLALQQTDVAPSLQPDWLAMMQQVLRAAEQTSLPQPNEVANAGAAVAATEPSNAMLQVGHYQFELPRSLQRLAAQRSKWLSLGGIATARLPSGEPHHLSLLLIDKHTDVPLHTHQGLEMTLILAGEIVDEHGSYGPGDLLINSPDDTHRPRNIAAEPCLCLSVLSAPLQFKEGLTRWLNPLQRFFY